MLGILILSGSHGSAIGSLGLLIPHSTKVAPWVVGRIDKQFSGRGILSMLEFVSPCSLGRREKTLEAENQYYEAEKRYYEDENQH